MTKTPVYLCPTCGAQANEQAPHVWTDCMRFVLAQLNTLDRFKETIATLEKTIENNNRTIHGQERRIRELESQTFGQQIRTLERKIRDLETEVGRLRDNRFPNPRLPNDGGGRGNPFGGGRF